MRRLLRRAWLVVPVVLSVAAAPANAQGTGSPVRKIRPAEQALLDRIAADFSKILPPIPTGWVEVEKKIFNADGTVADMGPAPISVEYEWRIGVADLAAREAVVQKRLEAMVESERARLESAADRNQKLLEEYAAKIEAAISRNSQAELKRLQDELAKKMADGMKEGELPKVAAPELSDTYAHIRLAINPYNASALATETPVATPAGFVAAGRRERIETQSDREGETWYLLGTWQAQPGSSRDWTLKFVPEHTAAVYGIVLEIEARADRADALLKAMDIARLKALLK